MWLVLNPDEQIKACPPGHLQIGDNQARQGEMSPIGIFILAAKIRNRLLAAVHLGNRIANSRLLESNSHQFQIIGILNKLYVLMENQDGLVLVDQHAAHERILFEELRRRMEEQGVPSQRLLLAQTSPSILRQTRSKGSSTLLRMRCTTPRANLR